MQVPGEMTPEMLAVPHGSSSAGRVVTAGQLFLTSYVAKKAIDFFTLHARHALRRPSVARASTPDRCCDDQPVGGSHADQADDQGRILET